MDLVKILYQAHVQMTNTNPITYHEFNLSSYDFSSLTQEEFKKITNECFETYKETDIGKIYGSVHVNPSFWSLVYVQSMANAKHNKESICKVPNGCCNTDGCGIKLFYEILDKYFSK
jgi:hypothetical protein